jgi:hypothetical protein
MALQRIKQLDWLECWPNGRYRVQVSRIVIDTADPTYAALEEDDPSDEQKQRVRFLKPGNPSHAAAIQACQAALAAARLAFNTDR